jgi:hypothetical protein
MILPQMSTSDAWMSRAACIDDIVQEAAPTPRERKMQPRTYGPILLQKGFFIPASNINHQR